MHEFIDDKGNKLVLTDIEAMILYEMGFFSSLKNTKIRFNPRPFSNPLHLKEQTKTPTPIEENLIDLHIEIANKVDTLIAKHEKELLTSSFEPMTVKKQQLTLEDIVEIRKQEIKTPEPSVFTPTVRPEDVFEILNSNEELFEIEIPKTNQTNLNIAPNIEMPTFQDVEITEDEEAQSSMFISEEPKKKWLFGLGKVKVRTKKVKQKQNKPKTSQKKINGVTKAKMELQETKKEIEEFEKKLKQKEKELKTQQKQKRKQQKLKKIEEKQKQKEKIKKEKEQEKLQKQRQKQLEAERKIKELEEKKLAKEKEKQDLQKQKLTKTKEKQLETEQKIKEYEEKKLAKKKEKKSLFGKKEKKKKPQEKTIKPTPEIMPEQKQVEEPVKTVQVDTSVLEDMQKLLPVLDKLLEQLPEEVIEEFAKSENFELYEKIMTKIKNK